MCFGSTIEEREEYEPHLREGTVVFAGVDYGRILWQAEKEADVRIRSNSPLREKTELSTRMRRLGIDVAARCAPSQGRILT